MRKITSIFLLTTLVVSLLGFQLSLEKCCEEFKLYFGVSESCDMGCCDAAESSDCCDTTTIQKESKFLTYTFQELGQNILTPIIVHALDLQIFSSETACLKQPDLQVEIHNPPERILFCTYRC